MVGIRNQPFPLQILPTKDPLRVLTNLSSSSEILILELGALSRFALVPGISKAAADLRPRH